MTEQSYFHKESHEISDENAWAFVIGELRAVYYDPRFEPIDQVSPVCC